MDKATYELLKQQIESEYKEKLSALTLVYGMARKLRREEPAAIPLRELRHVQLDLPSESDSKPESLDDKDREPRGFVVAAVEEVLPGFEGPFTWMEVLQVLNELNPDRQFHEQSVRQAVRNLADRGDLVVTREGAGRVATQYRLK